MFPNNPYPLPLFMIAVVSIVLALAVWHRRRGQRGVWPFVVLMVSLVIWTAGYAVELAVPTLSQKIFWVQIQFFGIVGAPLATLLFALDYLQRDDWLTPQRIALLSAIPVISVLMVFTNGLHWLMYSEIALEHSVGFPNFDGTFGPWFWVNIAYAYLMMVAAVILMGRNLLRESRLYRRQTFTMLFAATIPWLGNLLHASGLSPVPQIDITPFAFSITGAILAWSLMRFDLLTVVPAARDLIIENMADPVIVLNPEGRIVDVNSATRAAFAASNGTTRIMGKSIDEALNELKDPLEAIKDQRDGNVEITLMRGGDQRTYDLRATALQGEDEKENSGKVIVLRDIANIKKAEQALIYARDEAIKTSEFKTRMVAAVSHDFRTPLAAIIAFADMMKEEIIGPMTPDQTHAVDRIMDNTRRLNALVGDLLDQSQLESGKITLHTSKFTPRQLVEPVGLLNVDIAREKGLDLRFTIEENMPKQVYGDLARLHQVLSNLVTNAIKYTNEGSISVRLFAPDSKHWAIEVKDTGIGIPAPYQERVFEPFWRARNPAVAEESGVGLGLAITQQLVKLMDGEITLTSKQGEGSTFCVMLPSQSLRERLKNEKAARISH